MCISKGCYKYVSTFSSGSSWYLLAFSEWFVMQCQHIACCWKSWKQCATVSSLLETISTLRSSLRELPREAGNNDCESEALSLTLAGLSNIKNAWCSSLVRYWILQVTDHCAPGVRSLDENEDTILNLTEVPYVINRLPVPARWIYTGDDESQKGWNSCTMLEWFSLVN